MKVPYASPLAESYAAVPGTEYEPPAPPDPETIDAVIEVAGLVVTIEHPTGPGADQPTEVNWGDGTVEFYHGAKTEEAPDGFPAEHTYAAAGVQTITVDPQGDEFPVASFEVTTEAPAAEQLQPIGASPDETWLKADIQLWLLEQGVDYPGTATKGELLGLVATVTTAGG